MSSFLNSITRHGVGKFCALTCALFTPSVLFSPAKVPAAEGENVGRFRSSRARAAARGAGVRAQAGGPRAPFGTRSEAARRVRAPPARDPGGALSDGARVDRLASRRGTR